MDDSWELSEPSYSSRLFSQRVNSNQLCTPPFAQLCVEDHNATGSNGKNNNMRYQTAGLGSHSLQLRDGGPGFSNVHPTTVSESILQIRPLSSSLSSALWQRSRPSFIASNQRLFASAGDTGGLAFTTSGSFICEPSPTAAHLQSVRAQALQRTEILTELNSMDVSKPSLSPGHHRSNADVLSHGASTPSQMVCGITHMQSNSTAKHQLRLNRNAKLGLDASFGLRKQPAFTKVRPSRPRVYCAGMFGSIIVGEITISDTGQLGIMCFCHHQNMSVSAFSEHAGLFNVNPGDAIHMESGETIMQWWKALLSQFGGKAVEDHIGWVGNQTSSKEEAALEVKCNIFQSKVSRSGHLDSSLAGIAQKPDNTQIKSNEVCMSTHDGLKVFCTSNDDAAGKFGQPVKRNIGGEFVPSFESLTGSTDGACSDLFPSNTFYSSFHLNKGNPGNLSQNVGQDFVPSFRSSSCRSEKIPLQKGIDYGSWINDGTKFCQSDNDRIASSFELRLGQPFHCDMTFRAAFLNPSPSRVPPAMMQGNSVISGPNSQPATQHKNEYLEQSDSRKLVSTAGQHSEYLPRESHVGNCAKSMEPKASTYEPKDSVHNGIFSFMSLPRAVTNVDVGPNHDQNYGQTTTLASAEEQYTTLEYVGAISNNREAEAQTSYATPKASKHLLEGSHCRYSNLDSSSRVEMETQLKNVADSITSPSPCVLYERSSLQVTEPVNAHFSPVESIAGKTVEAPPSAALDSGGSCSSHTCWAKRSICDGGSEVVSSSDRNDVLYHSSAAFYKTMSQRNCDQQGIVEDDGEVVEAARDPVTGTVGCLKNIGQKGKDVDVEEEHSPNLFTDANDQIRNDHNVGKAACGQIPSVEKIGLCHKELGLVGSKYLVHQIDERGLLQPESMSGSLELKDESAEMDDPLLNGDHNETFCSTKIWKRKYLHQGSTSKIEEIVCKELTCADAENQGMHTNLEGATGQATVGGFIDKSQGLSPPASLIEKIGSLVHANFGASLDSEGGRAAPHPASPQSSEPNQVHAMSDKVGFTGSDAKHATTEEEKHTSSFSPVEATLCAHEGGAMNSNLKRKRSIRKHGKCSRVIKVPYGYSGTENICLRPRQAKDTVQKNCQKLVIKLAQMSGKPDAKPANLNSLRLSVSAENENHPALVTGRYTVEASLGPLLKKAAGIHHQTKQKKSAEDPFCSEVLSSYGKICDGNLCIKAVKVASLSAILDRTSSEKSHHCEHRLNSWGASTLKPDMKGEAGKSLSRMQMVNSTGRIFDRKVRMRSLCELSAKGLERVEEGVTSPLISPLSSTNVIRFDQNKAHRSSSVCISNKPKPLSLNERRAEELAEQHALTEAVWSSTTLGPCEISCKRQQSIHTDTRPSNHAGKPGRVHLNICGSKVPTCCVCGRPQSEINNVLLPCNHCGITVHQECYGVAKVSNNSWLCRPCRAAVSNAVCVLCGYAHGALTRAAKSQGIVKGLLRALHENLRNGSKEYLSMYNSSSLNDPNAIQWVHVVCALWMPGTRCLDVNNMAAFDVCGVASAQRKLVCSLCMRPGGACIKCRVEKCTTCFHPWCAHVKGLLKNIVSDTEGDVEFFGTCFLHRIESEMRSTTLELERQESIRQDHTHYNDVHICKRKRSSRKAGNLARHRPNGLC